MTFELLPANGDRTRFATEARALSAPSHPNIVAIHDVGENYPVTELVEGAPLKATGSPQAAEIAPQTAEGCRRALPWDHPPGPKPANNLIHHEGRVKIIDPGLVKRAADCKETPTLDGVLMGTVAYVSPEQVRRVA